MCVYGIPISTSVCICISVCMRYVHIYVCAYDVCMYVWAYMCVCAKTMFSIRRSQNMARSHTLDVPRTWTQVMDCTWLCAYTQCAYTCMYVLINPYVCICICPYANVCMYGCLYLCMLMCMYGCLYLCMLMCMYGCLYLCICTVYAYMYVCKEYGSMHMNGWILNSLQYTSLPHKSSVDMHMLCSCVCVQTCHEPLSQQWVVPIIYFLCHFSHSYYETF